MSLSRTRRKELKRLKSNAEQLWAHQQEVLETANAVAREASRQASILAREELAPRVREGYQHYVMPTVSSARGLVNSASHTLERTVLPALGTAVGTALSVADIAKEARVRSALSRLGINKPEPKKSGSSAGTVIAIIVGAVALVGVAYAVWQTFRADDELWIADDEVDAAAETPPPTV